MKRFVLILSFCLIACSIQSYCDMPTAQFLLVSQGARAEAMGGSVVSHCFDYTASYWNPAAAAFVQYPEIGFNSALLVSEINNGSFVFVYPFKKLSLGIQALNESSKVDSYDYSGNNVGIIKNTNSNTTLLLASKIYSNFSLGFTLGTTKMKLADYESEASNFKLGLIYIKNEFNFGFSLSNLGGKLAFADNSQGEEQPVIMRLGASRSFLNKKNLLLSLSLNNVLNDDKMSGFGLGGEYILTDDFMLRTGINSKSGYGNSNTTTGSLGFGVFYSWLNIDYAHTFSAKDLQGTDTDRISISLEFGREEKKTTKKRKTTKARKTTYQETDKIELKNLAIADFSGKNVSQADASIFSDFLRTELVKIGTFNIIEKSNMDKILAEAAFQQTGCTTSDCAVQIGKILNVHQMLVGSLSKLMDTYYITANLVDVETGKIIASFDEEANNAKELKSASVSLAEKIAELK